MAAVTPRMRRYVNATHKKRAARARAAERRTDTTVTLAPKGWLYMNSQTDHDRNAIWSCLSDEEKLLISLMCDTGITLDGLRDSVMSLSMLVNPADWLE